MSYEKTSTELNEILCQSIDDIVLARLKDVKFDETIVCKIIDNSKKDQGIYNVSNGSIIFEAYSDTTSYANEEQVYVLIPQGDYSAPKTILNRYKEQNTPMQAFKGIETTIPLEEIGADDPEFSIQLTNDAVETTHIIADELELQLPIKNYNSLVLSGNFITENPKASMGAEGTYGLRARLTISGQDNPIYVELDARRDMFGDPMHYYTLFPQSKQSTGLMGLDQEAFITGVQLEVYQNGKFTLISEEITRIGLNNTYLYVGHDVTIDNQTPHLRLIANDYANYTINDTRQLAVFFCQEVNGVFDRIQGSKYITLQQKINNIWTNLQDTGLVEFESWSGVQRFTINLDSTEPIVEYRAIYQNPKDGIEYISNELSFQNTISNDINAFSIILGENSMSYYPMYDENNQIIANQRNKERKINVQLKNYYHTSLIGDEVIWYVPKNASMLKVDQSLLINDGWSIDEDTNFIICSHDIGEDKQIPDFTYKINEWYQINWTNNTLKCEIIYNGVVNILYQNFSFFSQGNSGTKYTLIIATQDGYAGWVNTQHSAQTPLVYEVKLYDPDGNDITGNHTYTWTAHLPSFQHGSDIDDDTIYYISSFTSGNTYSNTLQVTTTVNNIILTQTIPVLYMHDVNDICTIPWRCYYDYAGNILSPSGNQGYELQILNTTFNTWSLKVYDKNNPDKWFGIGVFTEGGNITTRSEGFINDAQSLDYIKKYAPRIKDNKLIFAKVCSADFAEKYNLVLDFYYNRQLIYLQPILITHDKYASSVLNDWDDSELVLDDEDNKILTSFMAAGTKNLKNQFEGVLIGDIGKSDGIVGSGIIGIKNGIQTFKFDTTGVATLGAEGSGQIIIDGTRGTIKSPGETGMTINLDEGIITSKNFELNAYDASSKTGLLLNSAPDTNESYFFVGDRNNNYIEYESDGTLTTKLAEMNIVADNLDVNVDTNNDGKSEFILNTDSNERSIPYFQIGTNENNHIVCKKDGTLDINLDNIAINTNTFTLNANTGNRLYLTNNGYDGEPEFYIGDDINYLHFQDRNLDIVASQFNLTGTAGDDEYPNAGIFITNKSFRIQDTHDNKFEFDGQSFSLKVQLFTLNAYSIGTENTLLLTNNGTNNKPQFKVGTQNEYINFENGQLTIQAQEFNLNASDVLILNSAPSADIDPYFQVGNTNDAQIKFTKKGNLSINANNFNLNTRASSTSSGIEISSTGPVARFISDGLNNYITFNGNANSNRHIAIQAANGDNIIKITDYESDTVQKPYLKIGNNNEYIQFQNGSLTIQVKDLSITSANTNGIFGASNGFTPWIFESGTEEYPDIREIRWTGSEYDLIVYKQSNIYSHTTGINIYYGGAAIFYDCSHLINMGELEVTINIRLPEQGTWSRAVLYPGAVSSTEMGSPFMDINNFPNGQLRYDTAEDELGWGDDQRSMSFNVTFTEDKPYLMFAIRCIHSTENTNAPGVLYSEPFHCYLSDLSIILSGPQATKISDHILNTTYDSLSNNFGDGIYMSNGQLLVNASAIRTGILASSDNELQWNLNTGEITLQNDAYFAGNDNFKLGSLGLTLATSNSLQSQLTNTSFIYYTPNYTATTTNSSGPGYYYKEQKTNAFGTNLYIRDASTGKLFDEGPYLEPSTMYRIICNSNGEFLDPETKQVMNENSKYYWLKFEDRVGDFKISKIYNNKNIFADTISNTTAVVSGGPISASAYTGNKIELTQNNSEIILSANGKWIKITGEAITTSENYSKPNNW